MPCLTQLEEWRRTSQRPSVPSQISASWNGADVMGHLKTTSSGQGWDLPKVTYNDCGGESQGPVFHPGCLLYWVPAVCRMQWCSNLPLCSLSHAVPSVCLVQCVPFFWIIITGLPRYRSHHSSGEPSLSPCLPGHNLHSVPFLGALEHYLGIFVIALILCMMWRSSVSLLSAFSLVHKSWKVQAYFYLSLYPQLLYNSRCLTGAV